MSVAEPDNWKPSTPAELRELRGPASLKIAAHVCSKAKAGRLTFVMPDGQRLRFGPGTLPEAQIDIVDPRFARRAIVSGDIGFAEGYMAGEWSTPDLTAVLEFFAVNFDDASRISRGEISLQITNIIRHALNANTRSGSKKNILSHYDLGNDFYSLWLDPSMTYSSAIYTAPDTALTEAQYAKYTGIAQRLGLEPGRNVLEIGSGWGGFAEFAASRYGANVTSVTISDAQYAYAKKRIFDAGLNDRVDIQLRDYRDISGRFDAVASIEMFEAVGERYWPQYFAKVSEVLHTGARAALQVITIDEQLFDDYRTRPDFIKRFIFPGGMLPTVSRFHQEARKAGLETAETYMFGRSYALTLNEWAKRFQSAWSDIMKLGFDERFKRLWMYYLCYCEAGFRSGRIDVGQFALVKA
jgi:cyclopropane-fatty-acyl-phospholipid synthase